MKKNYLHFTLNVINLKRYCRYLVYVGGPTLYVIIILLSVNIQFFLFWFFIGSACNDKMKQITFTILTID